MFKLKTILVRAVLPLAAALCAGSASASTVIATLNSVGSGDTIGLHAVRPDGSSIGEQVLNGITTFTKTGGTDTSSLEGPSSGSFSAFASNRSRMHR